MLFSVIVEVVHLNPLPIQGIPWKDIVAIFQFLSMSDSVTPCIAVCQASLSFTISQSLFKFVSIESVMLTNHLIQCHPLLLLLFSPASFPASGSFPVSRLFTAGGQNIGSSALASILPVNIQDWFPFWSTGLISLHSEELLGVFSIVVCAFAEKGFPDMRQNER